MPLTLGPVEYLHPDNGIYIDPHGEIEPGLDDREIQRRQLAFIPEWKQYVRPAALFERVRALPVQLPRYLADHSIGNYAYRFHQLLIQTGRSP